jgi:membrane protease YdiL (CAAX protease family)
MYGVYFPIAYLMIFTLPNTRNMISSAKRRIKPWYFVLLCLGSYGMMQVLNLGTNLLSTIADRILGMSMDNVLLVTFDEGTLVANIIAMAVIAPLFEEFIFRKILYDKLIGYGPHVYILVSAILFMSFHTNLFQMLYTFLLGLVLAVVYAYTKNFVYNWLLHFVINSIACISLVIASIDHPQAESILESYSISLLCVIGVGVIIAICYAATDLRKFSLGYGAPLFYKGAKAVFLNPGMILFYIATAGLTLLVQFSLLISSTMSSSL